MFSDYNYLFKIVVIGDSGVGKTNLLSQFIDHNFLLDQKPTVGVEFATKTVKISEQDIRCQIWDTAGQERFRAVTKAYYKGAVGALVVFDLTNTCTFQHIGRWIEEAEQNTQINTVILLIGNKVDLQDRVVSESTISQFLKRMEKPIIYMETSALTGENVQQAFHKLIEEIYVQKKRELELAKDKIKLRDSVNMSESSQVPEQRSPRKDLLTLKSQNFAEPPVFTNSKPKKTKKKCC